MRKAHRDAPLHVERADVRAQLLADVVQRDAAKLLQVLADQLAHAQAAELGVVGVGREEKLEARREDRLVGLLARRRRRRAGVLHERRPAPRHHLAGGAVKQKLRARLGVRQAAALGLARPVVPASDAQRAARRARRARCARCAQSSAHHWKILLSSSDTAVKAKPENVVPKSSAHRTRGRSTGLAAIAELLAGEGGAAICRRHVRDDALTWQRS